MTHLRSDSESVSQPAGSTSQLCLPHEPLGGLLPALDPKPHSPEGSTSHWDVPLLRSKQIPSVLRVLVQKGKQCDLEPERLKETRLDARFETDVEARSN